MLFVVFCVKMVFVLVLVRFCFIRDNRAVFCIFVWDLCFVFFFYVPLLHSLFCVLYFRLWFAFFFCITALSLLFHIRRALYWSGGGFASYKPPDLWLGIAFKQPHFLHTLIQSEPIFYFSSLKKRQKAMYPVTLVTQFLFLFLIKRQKNYTPIH